MVKMHRLKGYSDYKIDRETIENYTRGAANMLLSGPAPPSNKRRVMTLQILRLLGHQLASSGWSKNSQQTIWATSLVGFFSSARMGELLAPHEVGLDPTATLTCIGGALRGQCKPKSSFLFPFLSCEPLSSKSVKFAAFLMKTVIKV
jgi:hypothetical protein